MASSLLIAIMVLSSAALVSSDNMQITWASVVMAFHGEREALLSTGSPALTPLGAQQALISGSTVRTRYIEGPGTTITESYPINGISKQTINNRELYILTTDDDYVATSAQAFMQGLYPPIRGVHVDAGSMLANGTLVQFPLQGYQYPAIKSISPSDFNYVWVGGNENCPQYQESESNYFGLQDYKKLLNSTLSFYKSLIPPIFQGVIPNSQVTFQNAYALYDYASFQYTHNLSVAKNVSPSSMAQLRSLASSQQYSLNGDLSASGLVSGDKIRAVAGRTFTGKVLSILGQNIRSNGINEKLNLFFTGYEPFLAFFALSNLSRQPKFRSLPEPGSVMVFELFSNDPNVTEYPGVDQLWVRFLFRNGTSDTEPLISYPLFGRGRSATDMSWADFKAGMSSVAISDIGTWCKTCDSNAIYCHAFVDSQCNSTTSSTGALPSDIGTGTVSCSKITPVTAGVIGAAVSIAVALSLICACNLCRTPGHRPGVFVLGYSAGGSKSAGKLQSSLGGFKGAGKLASDADLTHSIAKDGTGTTVVKHERVGSWELADAKEAAAKDLEHGSVDKVVSNADYSQRDDDDNISAVNPFGDPVKVDDRI